MAFIGAVRKNGQLSLSGAVTVGGNFTAGGSIIGQGAIQVQQGFALSWNGRTQLQSTADGFVKALESNGSSAATVIAKAFAFTPAASTFAQTATITNGPRAANPVAWARVLYNETSSGRIPIW